MATIATDKFRRLGQMEAKFLGMPHLPLIIVPHPVGGQRPETVLELADIALQQVIEALTTPRELLEQIT